MTTKSKSVRILVVDDEQDIADLYSMWLDAEHSTDVAYDGAQALDLVSESTDIIFLDRQMPGISGDEVLDRVDSREIDCRVVMVTAVDPDFDIVEMPFDDYLTKPVTREDLVETVDEMLSRGSYDDQVQEYFAAASKKATLESEKNPAELEGSDEYAEINGRVAELAEQADQTANEVDDFESLLQDLPAE
jgi:DNA-binding response OmpR family regulator